MSLCGGVFFMLPSLLTLVIHVVHFRHPSARPPLAYNRLDDEYKVNRASHMGPYRVKDGLPLYVYMRKNFYVVRLFTINWLLGDL